MRVSASSPTRVEPIVRVQSQRPFVQTFIRESTGQELSEEEMTVFREVAGKALLTGEFR